MLVLTRKNGESIIIQYQDIEIEIICAMSNHPGTDIMKLCFSAPKEVKILRKELTSN